MVDLSKTISPKSDQLNADDLITGSRIIKITGVTAKTSSTDQPVSISYEGDNGKPYKPCLSMRRVIVQVWGKDGKEYVGRSMELYLDPNVTFGKEKVGGIRISRMSHMNAPKTMALTATRAQRRAYTVKPLEIVENKEDDRLQSVIANLSEVAQSGMVTLQTAYVAAVKSFNDQASRDKLAEHLPAWKEIAAKADVTETSDNPFGEGNDH